VQGHADDTVKLDAALQQLDQNIGRINPSLRGPIMLNRSGVITLAITIASAIVPNANVFGQEQIGDSPRTPRPRNPTVS